MESREAFVEGKTFARFLQRSYKYSKLLELLDVFWSSFEAQWGRSYAPSTFSSPLATKQLVSSKFRIIYEPFRK